MLKVTASIATSPLYKIVRALESLMALLYSTNLLENLLEYRYQLFTSFSDMKVFILDFWPIAKLKVTSDSIKCTRETVFVYFSTGSV